VTFPRISDTGIERMVSALLRAGVLLSGSVVLAGGIYFLWRHAGEPADYRVFHGQPSVDRIFSQILKSAMAGRSLSVIQLGILLLIATPILRVALSLVGFLLERDRTYVLITGIVLVLLLCSLMG
jgi:uncharacterized membrane protein